MVLLILGRMSAMMLEAGPAMIRKFSIPDVVIQQAYRDNLEHRQRVRMSLASVAKLCIDLGLLDTRRVFYWKRCGLGNPLTYAT